MPVHYKLQNMNKFRCLNMYGAGKFALISVPSWKKFLERSKLQIKIFVHIDA